MKKFDLAQIELCQGTICNNRTILQFLLSFNGYSISNIHINTKLCKYQHFFSLKTGNLIINWAPYKHTMPESLSSQSDKKINGSSKITISQLFSELGKICTTQSYIQKTPIFYLFLELRKPKKSIKSNLQKSQNLFVNREKLGIIA